MKVEIRRVPAPKPEVRFRDVLPDQFFVSLNSGVIYCKFDEHSAIYFGDKGMGRTSVGSSVLVEILNVKKIVLQVEE